jgi:hypothetical protein
MNALPGSSVGMVEAQPLAVRAPTSISSQPGGWLGVRLRPDRRNSESRAALMNRIVGEYRDMPGLELTLAQATRLFGLGPATCWRVLHECVDEGWLCCTPAGMYRLATPKP